MSRTSYRVRFQGGTHFELSGIVDRPADRQPCPVVVFSHCFTCNKDLKAIVRISRALAERGVAVLRYDMTGLGGSDGDFSKTNFHTNVADLCAAIRYTTCELGPVTGLMGHSFGGAASLAVAGKLEATADLLPASPQAVVALAAPSDTVHLAQLLSRMNPAIEDSGRGSVTIGGIDWEIRREMLEDFRRHDLPAAIARIEAATLLLHSPDDETVSYDHALRILGLIQNSPTDSRSASLISLPGADHLLVNSPIDIEFVAESTSAFLRRYAMPPA